MEKNVKVTYTARDGKVFLSEEDCLKYERKLDNSDENKVFKLNNGHKISKKDIMDFFKQVGCENCPFAIECDNTYGFTRAKSTDTLTICDALSGPEDWY